MLGEQLVFAIHRIAFIAAVIGGLLSAYALIVHPIVFMLWYINRNDCIMCWLEHRLFGKTILGDGPVFEVPSKTRILLYAGFLAGAVYQALRCLPGVAALTRAEATCDGNRGSLAT